MPEDDVSNHIAARVGHVSEESIYQALVKTNPSELHPRRPKTVLEKVLSNYGKARRLSEIECLARQIDFFKL